MFALFKRKFSTPLDLAVHALKHLPPYTILLPMLYVKTYSLPDQGWGGIGEACGHVHQTRSQLEERTAAWGQNEELY